MDKFTFEEYGYDKLNGGGRMNCAGCNTRLESTASGNGLCQDCINDDSVARNQKSFGFAQGWLCPKCGAVLAPTQNHCVFCAPTTQPRWDIL